MFQSGKKTVISNRLLNLKECRLYALIKMLANSQNDRMCDQAYFSWSYSEIVWPYIQYRSYVSVVTNKILFSTKLN